MDDSFFRAASGVLLLAGGAISGFYRARAERAGGALPEQPQGRPSVLIRLVLLAGILTVVVLPIFHPPAASWLAVPPPTWLRWIGVAIATATVPLIWWTVASIGANISPSVSTRAGASLVTHGPYAWIRHPVYTCGFLLLLGLDLMLGSLPLTVGLLGLLFWLPVRVAAEEANLIDSHGEAYRGYIERTGRFLPKLSRWWGAVVVGVLAPSLGSSAAAQTISVRVHGDGKPLAGATVLVDSLDGRSDSLGLARFPVAPGRHRIVARKIGWVPDSTTVDVAADTMVTIDLVGVPLNLEELTVSSNRTSRKVEDEALRVEILDVEEIEEKQLMTPGDIVMMLNETGGVRTATTNPSLGAAGIRIRGLQGRYTQVLADGLPLYGDRVGSFGPLQIPPVDLGQVEIIKGPASALFGGSAMAGLVNLLTREIEPGATLLLNGTTLGGGDAVGFVGGNLNMGWRYTGLAGVHGQTRQDRDDDGWLDVAGYRRVVLRPRLLWRDDRGQSFLATIGATVERRKGGTADGATAPDGQPFLEQLDTDRFDAGTVGRWRISSTGPWLQVRASGTTLKHRHQFGPVEEPDRHQTAFAEAALNQVVGTTDMVLGAAVAFDRFRSETAPLADYRYVVPGIFAQLERQIGPIIVAASGRFDHHNRFGDFASPRISALWKPGRDWSVRGTFGLGYFAPTPLIEETERVGLARLVLPVSIRSERAASAAIDLHGITGPVELNLSVFGTRVRHPVLARQGAAAGSVELFNGDLPTWSRGTDISVRYRRGEIAVTASYALVATKQLDPEAGITRAIPLTPRHTGGLVGTYEPAWGRIGIEAYYTGRQVLDDDPYRPESRPFLVIGGLVERRFGGVGIFLNAENLLDVRQTDYDRLVRPSPGRGGTWTTDAWAPLDGRVLNGGVRWNW